MFKKIELAKIKNYFTKLAKSAIFKKICLVIGSSLVLASLFFVGFNFLYNDRVFPNTFIGATNFGGHSRAEAEEILNNLEKNSQDANLIYDWQDKSYRLSLSALQVNWQSRNSQTLDELFGVGRSSGAAKIFKEQFRSIFHTNRVMASFSLDSAKLDEFISQIAQDIDIKEKDASIEIKDLKPVVIPEEIGRQFPIDKNRQIAQETIGSFDFSANIAFLVEQINPQVTTLGAEAAIVETEDLLSSHLILKAREKTFQLFPADIAPMIIFVPVYGKKGVLGINSITGESPSAKDLVIGWTLSPEIAPDKMAAFVDKIAAEVNQPAQDAKFEVSDGRVQTFQVSQTGYELEKDKAIALIISALKKGEVTVDLTVKVTEPKVTDDASTVGIKELVGEGRTSWRGSPPNRIHNLTLGAQKISGTLVEPGQEFSTLHALSPVTAANGYLPELVIKNSTQVEPDIGGGLCQVSTTLFRAAIYSGLKVTDRTPHSFRVSYYEPPVGMDATVFDPAPDFRFINDYSTPVLIWAIASNNSLVFQIYGTKDGRQINISDPVLFDYVSAPGAVYSESSTMAEGAIRQVERATAGVSASFNYKVVALDGAILENETYVSKYVPIPNTYIYGPGTTGIPGVEGAAAPPAESTPVPSPTSVKKIP